MSEKTVHKSSTTHGRKTVHKLPSDAQSSLDTLKDLSVQLYPTGRAWYKPENGTFEKLHDGLNVSFARLIKDEKRFLDGLFPDNDNFNEEDAELWEYRLGLITNTDLSLDLRKSAISRKLGHPNNIKSRQSKFFIENQLRSAGFDVYIHENTPPYQTPFDVASITTENIEHQDSTEHGSSTSHGADNFLVIANSVEIDEDYAIGTNGLWSTFFIGGQNLGDYASIEATRLKEFKELVIKLKPAHTVAFIFINFV